MDSEEVRLVRAANDQWVLATTFGYPANPGKVRQLLDELQGARRKAFVTRRAETFDEYASDDGWTHVEIQGTAGEPVSFDVGKSAGWPDSFVKLYDGKEPIVVRAWNLTPDEVRLSIDAWVDAGIWPSITLPDVQKIVVHQRDEKSVISFVREEKLVADAPTQVWKMVAPKPGEPVLHRVEGLVRAFTGMRFQSIAARSTGEADNARFGLDKPAYRILIYGRPIEEGQGPPMSALLVGNEVPAKAEGESPAGWYLQREGDEWVYEVGTMSIADFRQAADDFLPTPEPEETDDEEGEGDPSERAVGSPDDGPPPGDLPPLPPLPPDDAPDAPDAPEEPDTPDAPGVPEEPQDPQPPAPPEEPDDE